jgi:hypothetical protein
MAPVPTPVGLSVTVPAVKDCDDGSVNVKSTSKTQGSLLPAAGVGVNINVPETGSPYCTSTVALKLGQTADVKSKSKTTSNTHGPSDEAAACGSIVRFPDALPFKFKLALKLGH